MIPYFALLLKAEKEKSCLGVVGKRKKELGDCLKQTFKSMCISKDAEGAQTPKEYLVHWAALLQFVPHDSVKPHVSYS